MKRAKSSEASPLPAQAVTYEQRLKAIDVARQAGHLVLKCGPPALDGHQIVTLNPSDTSDTHFWFDWREPYTEEGTDTQHRISYGYVGEVTYAGVKRRPGLLRRSVQLDIAPEEVMVGDRIALQIDNKTYFSERVRDTGAESALGVVEGQPRIPELALSTE